MSGRVQGVGYRAFTRREAALMGLSVSATNLPDGRVEVIACGEAERIDALRERLRAGPRWSRVESLEDHAAACRADRP